MLLLSFAILFTVRNEGLILWVSRVPLAISPSLSYLMLLQLLANRSSHLCRSFDTEVDLFCNDPILISESFTKGKSCPRWTVEHLTLTPGAFPAAPMDYTISVASKGRWISPFAIESRHAKAHWERAFDEAATVSELGSLSNASAKPRPAAIDFQTWPSRPMDTVRLTAEVPDLSHRDVSSELYSTSIPPRSFISRDILIRYKV